MAAANPRIPEIADWLAPKRTALVVFGLQADIASPEGRMAKAGNDVSAIQEAIEKQRQTIVYARGAGVPICFARCVTRAETDSPAWALRRARLGLDPDPLNRELEGGADFYPRRPASPGDLAVQTNRYSAFHNTDLEARLKELRVDTVVVCGQTTDLYVDATVRDGFQRDYQMFVVRDACAAYTPERHQAALEAMARDYAILIELRDAEDAWTG
jgi:ureidoacrylate peracid hydrolase